MERTFEDELRGTDGRETVVVDSKGRSVRSRLAVSTGSACSSSRLEPSYVLTAMGLSTKRAQSSLRFGIGRFNTVGEIDEAAALVVDAVVDIRRSRLHTA